MLRKQAAIEKRGLTLHPTEAEALKNAQATLARLAPAGTNAPPANAAEAGKPTPGAPATPGAPQPQSSAEGPRLQFSQGGSEQGSSEKKTAGQVMQNLAGDEGRFRRGKASQSKDFGEIAKEYALPEELSHVREHEDFGDVPTKKIYRIDLKAGGHAFLLHGTNGKVWVDTSQMRSPDGQAVEGGDLVYQAAMTYAHNNGLKFVEDPNGVKPIASFRRISQMLSNAMRHGTTEHLTPSSVENAPSLNATIPGWRQQQGPEDTATYEHNINQLALAEMNEVEKKMRDWPGYVQVMKRFAPKNSKPFPEPGPLGHVQLQDLKWNPEDDTVTHVPTGRRLSQGDFDQIVSGLDPARSGIGPTTLSRAIVARQALLGNVPGGYRVPNHQSEESGGRGREEAEGHGSEPFRLLEKNKQLFYSQSGASENSGLDEGSRGGSGGSGRKLASHFGSDPRQLAQQTAQTAGMLNQRVPGLLNDRTHVFHSVEDLLNSDYAKEHPLSKEDLDKLHSAEGFHDPKTGHNVVIAGNVELRHGETPHDALTRVILHERVGHDGLQALLGSQDSKAQKHWAGLTQRIKPQELDAIAHEPGYQHLAGDRNALAHEWFARQAEKSPHLLQQPGLLRDMWESFKAQLRKMSNNWKDTDESHLDTHLHELLRHSRKAALRPSSTSQANAQPGAART